MMAAGRRMAGNGRNTRAREAETRLGWRMAGLAFIMSSEAAAGAGIGWVVDYFAATTPWGLVLGAILGITVGLTSLLRGAWQLSKAMDAAGTPIGAKPLPPELEETDDDWDSDDNFERTGDG